MTRKMTPIAGLGSAEKKKKGARAQTPAKKRARAKSKAGPTIVLPPQINIEEPDKLLGSTISWEKVEPLHPEMLKLALDIIDDAPMKGSDAQSIIKLKIELARVAGVGRE